MINAKYIRLIIGIVGNVLSTAISLSHMPKFIQIYKKKSVEGVEPTRHFMMLIQCSLWVLYGLPVVHKDSILVSTSNGVGLVIEVIYVVVFYINCEGEPRKGDTYVCIVFVCFFVSLFYGITTLMVIWSVSFKDTFMGVVCNVINICFYLKLAMDKMEETKTCKYMPFWLSLVSFINAGIWTAYSLIYKIDIYVLINSAVLCAFQSIVHACYCTRQLCVTV